MILFLVTFFIAKVLCQEETSTETQKETPLPFYSSPIHRVPPKCDNILPGLQNIARGVDLTVLDLAHDYAKDDRDGFGETIFEFTCRRARKVQIEGKTFDLPDQFRGLKPADFNQNDITKAKVTLFDDWRKVKNQYAKNVGLTESPAKGWFSESESFSYLQKILQNSTVYILSMDIDIPLFTVNLLPRGTLRKSIAKFMLDYLSDLPNTYEEDPERYLDFLRSYGTHYFATGRIGGSLKFWSEVNRFNIHNKSQEYLVGNARSVFSEIVKAKSGLNITSNPIDDRFLNSSRSFYRPFGGDETLLESDGMLLWRDSLIEKPFIIGGELEPITNLIRDEAKRIQMTKALDIYMGLAYLEESKRLLNTYLIILPRRVKENIENLLRKIEAIQQRDVPSWSTLKKVIEEL